MNVRYGRRAAIGWWLRCRADRIDPLNAPRRLSGDTFTFEKGRGLVYRQDGRGCPIWYLGEDDYRKAFTESDSSVRQIDWTTMTYVEGD